MTPPDAPTQPTTDSMQARAESFARLVGWIAIGAGFALPAIATLSPNQGALRYAPISLGLLPAGLFLVTRGPTRRPVSAVLAALLLPSGAGALMAGTLTPNGFDGYRFESVTLVAGVVLLTIGSIHAWLSWASPGKRPIQVAALAMGVAIWIIFGVASLQTVAADDSVSYVEPLAMELKGAQLRVEVPHRGGCADSQLTVETAQRAFNVLEVLVIDDGEFRCAANCLLDWRAICTETLTRQLSPRPTAGTTLVAAARPATGLQRVPLAFLTSGILLGGVLWVGGTRVGNGESG